MVVVAIVEPVSTPLVPAAGRNFLLEAIASMPWRNAREHSRCNSQNGMTLGNLRQLLMLAAVAWTATCWSCPPLQNHAPQDLNWEPVAPS